MCKAGHFVAFEQPQNSKNPWLNKNTWLGEVLGGSWNSSQFLINFGAHYDDSAKHKTMIDDVVAERMRRHDVAGLAVDADDKMRWAGRQVKTRTTFVTPAGIPALLDGADAPARPLLLKVDIDSFDVLVTRAVLAVRSPAFVYVEINEKVPPPSCYCNDRVPAAGAWKRLAGDAYGCSLAGYVGALREYGYALVMVAYNDALFARADVARRVADALPGGRLPTAAEAWAAGYGDVPDVHRTFPWNFKNWPFYDARVPPKTRLDAMEAYPAFAKGAAAGQATFVRNATDGAWPCAGPPSDGPNAWDGAVKAALRGSAAAAETGNKQEKRFLRLLREPLAKALGPNAPEQPLGPKAIGGGAR